jgi:RimJ/RimL family protein N-acetyltransferase
MKADTRNERSQHTILGMGATKEGVFRKHRILSDGYQRDNAYFSFIDTEWPRIWEHLTTRIATKN